MGTWNFKAGRKWARGVFCLIGLPYTLATMAFHEPLSVYSWAFVMAALALLCGLMVAYFAGRDPRTDSVARLLWSIPAGILAAIGHVYILPGGDSKALSFTGGLAIGMTAWYYRKAIGPRPSIPSSEGAST